MVAGFVTTPLEGAIAQANGIDYMSSTSQSGVSTITVYLRLNYDADKALTEINTKIASVLNQLPAGTQQPTLTVKVGQTIDAMYIGFNSGVLEPNQITDYLVRVVQPKLQAVPGVQTAELLGGKYFALRAWLDPEKLAAHGLTAADVAQALAANNYIAGVGTTKGQMVQVNLTASTDLHTLDAFRNLVVKQSGPAIVRLKDVANVTLGNDDYDSRGRVRRQARGLYRHPGGAGRQSARCHQGRARGLSVDPGATAAGPERHHRLRLDRVRHQLDHTRWCARWSRRC